MHFLNKVIFWLNINSCANKLYSNQNTISGKIEQLIKSNKVVVFMKGVPNMPRCGFSNAVIQILRMHNVSYDAHNVLDNETLRQGVKEYSDWPTIPQIYIDGKFIGGCDILLQMHQNGELLETLKKAGIHSALLDTIQKDEKES